ncbi:hypothetical protein ACRE_078680 [Hapsidospora chrysogenum ATCC 11550]|uniref:Uncharacterized protein n=1 Tax=Hapsidospora chrysogenum (strain ATCC 11550 / CBS 779.69 / DSM 880 / IAM 14645 / JCM 23072 / IMI 49137) TaxID=857340 RepID=A0A086SWF7_HAPC1|nr:hypothetical protein ACRE_078680 [Hapsidospora chrysogenum ATCC 11550]
MLDENLPTYRFRTSSDNPLHTLLYYTHNGSEPTADYLIKRPPPSSSHNQYALGLFDIQYASVLYAEILLKPEWYQPTLSAAEIRANGGQSAAVAQVPQVFSVSLYNPDQTVNVRHQQGSWSKDAWEFEVPERSFRLPSTSRIDQECTESQVPELVPRVNFRWKRDGRMSRDMTCYMSGKTVGGKKNKEPDITIALFKAGKAPSVAIYEPNMRRVDVEDRKGLEVILLLSAEVIRDLYLSPRQDPFNTAGAMPPANVSKVDKSTASGPSMAGAATIAGPGMSGAAMSGAAMSGALANVRPSASQQPAGPDARIRADVEVEKKKKKKKKRAALMEQQTTREKEKKLQREQEEIKKMLEREEREEAERRRRERVEREKRVDRETEELRKKYGAQPALPPRPSPGPRASGALGGWLDAPPPPQPPRPRSVGPSPGPGGVRFAPEQQQQQQQQAPSNPGGGARKTLGNLLHNSPYAGAVAGTASGFFGGSAKDEEKRKKAKKKRSTHF